MATNQEEIKQSLHTQLFTTLIKLTKSNGKDQVVNDRISKKCEKLASSVIALAQEPSDSNIDLYKKKMQKLTHSKYIVSEALKVIKEAFPGDQNQVLRELIDIPLMDALAKENKPARPKKLVESEAKKRVEAMLRDKTIAQQENFQAKGYKQVGGSAGYIAEETATGNTFILKRFYKRHADCLTLSDSTRRTQAIQDRNDGVNELIASSMYQFLLYDRAPKEEMVIPDELNNKSLYVRSKFFDKVIQLAEFAKGTYTTSVGANNKNLKKLDGLEKVIAACHMLGDGDYHAGNLMVQNGKTITKIDHGRSFITFHQDFAAMVEETHKMFSYDEVNYTKAIKAGNLSFNIEEYSKALKQMTGQLDDHQIDAIIDQKVDELKKVKFNPKGLSTITRFEGDKFEEKQINNFDELRAFYKKNIKENLNNMKEIARAADTVAKFSNVSPEFKNGQWLEIFAKSPIKDPVAYAAHHNIEIEGKSALQWASEHDYQIKVPTQPVTINVQEQQWQKSLDGKWQEVEVSMPKVQKSVTSLNPTEYVADIDKRLESLENKIEYFVKETVTASKKITIEKLERFYDKLLTHLNKEKHLTDEDVKAIQNDLHYKENIVATAHLMEMTTPNLTVADKMRYKVANFCEKIGLSSLSKHLMHKITPEKLAKIDDTEKVVAESLKIKKILLKPKVKPVTVKSTPKARIGKVR
ncbi:MAG: hypothetical protein DMENIID0002_03770 [Rickettsia endosymbiont of Sergentomyia squamirostris]|uniref:LepB N-terminal domain-containing protein n=1 Tax=Candidatus Tisiphia endosymbiont of Sergentomyia squamirostris TaxID=3113639 RepID=A0AAT9G7G7_9RICK